MFQFVLDFFFYKENSHPDSDMIRTWLITHPSLFETTVSLFDKLPSQVTPISLLLLTALSGAFTPHPDCICLRGRSSVTGARACSSGTKQRTWQQFIRAGCSHYSLRAQHSCCLLMALTPSVAGSHVWMVHFVSSGSWNQSHPGPNAAAAAAGTEEEAGGQTRPGAKWAVAADKEGEADSCWYTE